MKQQPRIIDGGTGTELQRAGVPMNKAAWTAEAVLTHPELLYQVHASFRDAGAEVLIANTYAAAPHNLNEAGLGDHFEEIHRNAVRIARNAADEASQPCLVAGSISSTTFTESVDYSLLPMGDAARDYYARMVEIQVEAGVDMIILEMMREVQQTTAALRAAQKADVPVWVGFSCTGPREQDVKLLGSDITLEHALSVVPIHLADGVGIMHTLIEETPPALEVLQRNWDGFTFAYPHAGYFDRPNWIFEDVISPAGFAAEAKSIMDSGIDAVGGCCGITPEHIRAFCQSLDTE